jgi:hypothetical protein
VVLPTWPLLALADRRAKVRVKQGRARRILPVVANPAMKMQFVFYN